MKCEFKPCCEKEGIKQDTITEKWFCDSCFDEFQINRYKVQKQMTKDAELENKALLAQFIDVLEEIAKYNDIRDIKEDIKERLKLYKIRLSNSR
jgi:hypothetical protein